jgi:hypothetical protein
LEANRTKAVVKNRELLVAGGVDLKRVTETLFAIIWSQAAHSA